MDNTADKIEDFIDEHREHLGSNLRELEDKVKSATDWRVQYEKHTALAIGLAAGGGILLAHLTNPRQSAPQLARSFRSAAELEAPSEASDSRSPWKSEVAGQIDQVKSALIGVAAERLTDFVEGLLPGFKRQVEKRRPSY